MPSNDLLSELRAEYMQTALDETAESPPAINTYFHGRNLGVETQSTFRKLAIKGNWEGHWHKHHKRFMLQLIEEENEVLARAGTDFARKRTEFLVQRIKLVEYHLNPVFTELLERIDLLDDKALVQFAKLLTDMQNDIMKTLDRDKTAGGADDKGTQSLFGQLQEAVSIATATLALESGNPLTEGVEEIKMEDILNVSDEDKAFAYLDSQVLPTDG